MTKGDAEALILDHMRASSPHTVWPMPEDSDPDMYCGYLSFEQVGKLADALSHRPTKGEIDALIAEARASSRTLLDLSGRVGWKGASSHVRGILNSSAFALSRLADALSLLGDGAGDSSSSRDHAPGAGSALDEWIPTHRHAKRGSHYEVIAFGELQTENPVADGTPVTIYLGGNGAYWVRPTAEFNDGRFVPVFAPIRHSSAKPAEGEGSRDELVSNSYKLPSPPPPEVGDETTVERMARAHDEEHARLHGLKDTAWTRAATSPAVEKWRKKWRKDRIKAMRAALSVLSNPTGGEGT